MLFPWKNFELILVLILSWDITHKLPNLWFYWETVYVFISASYLANIITKERLREVLSNFHFFNNEEALPQKYQHHNKPFKVWWLRDYLNECLLTVWESKLKYVWKSTLWTIKTKTSCGRISKISQSNEGSRCDIDTL